MRQNILLQVFKEKTPCYPVCGFDKATCLPYIFLKFEKDLLFSELVVSDLYNCRSSRFSPSCPAAPAARLTLPLQVPGRRGALQTPPLPTAPFCYHLVGTESCENTDSYRGGCHQREERGELRAEISPDSDLLF